MSLALIEKLHSEDSEVYTDLHVRITATIISYSFLPFELVYGLLISAHQEDWLLVGLEMIHVLHQGEQGTD